MKDHICVVLTYLHPDIIKKSFDSIKNADCDFFIIENKSEKSDQIAEYFLQTDLTGYVQFEDNISNQAIDIFIHDFSWLLEKYKYITITDGDLYVYDVKSMFSEILENLEQPDAIVSSASLYRGNYYLRADRVIGTEQYDELSKKSLVIPGPVFTNTANNFVTIKRENLDLIQGIHYQDTTVSGLVYAKNKKWVATRKHLAYHLTWDLYVEDNPYYEWKKQVLPSIWKVNPSANVEYKKLIKRYEDEHRNS